MFELIFKKYFKPGTLHIFVFSFFVFIVLNIIENVMNKFHTLLFPNLTITEVSTLYLKNELDNVVNHQTSL